MADILTRAQLESYVNNFWYRPTADGKTWLSNQPIDINQARQTIVNGEADWEAVFLRDNQTGSGGGDALHFVRPAFAGAAFRELDIPASERRLIQAWAGLNDCAHFVSECFKAGGISVYSLNVQSLVDQLRARADTKTLAYFVTIAEVERIATSGILRTGDIFAYGTPDRSFAVHGHSTIFMENDPASGDAKIACHTRLDHPLFEGNWRNYAHPNTLHPMISVIHFGHDDQSPQLTSWVFGWWSVVWQGQTYYYYFDNRGRVGYTQTPPANTSQPLSAPTGKGYWFDLGSTVSIAWTDTGSLEEFSYTLPNVPGVAISGTWNRSEPIAAVKML